VEVMRKRSRIIARAGHREVTLGRSSWRKRSWSKKPQERSEGDLHQNERGSKRQSRRNGKGVNLPEMGTGARGRARSRGRCVSLETLEGTRNPMRGGIGIEAKRGVTRVHDSYRPTASDALEGKGGKGSRRKTSVMLEDRKQAKTSQGIRKRRTNGALEHRTDPLCRENPRSAASSKLDALVRRWCLWRGETARLPSRRSQDSFLRRASLEKSSSGL
jgi:hypothetical protein